MAYITYEDYMHYGASFEILEDEFPTLAERASDIIDEITMYKLQKGVFDVLTDYDKKQVKRATCAQLEFLYYNGVDSAFNGSINGSYHIGSTSITRDTGNGNSRVSPLAYKLLFPTGLLYRGVGLA